MSQQTYTDREEFIEQCYFFRVFRERIAQQIPAQEVLERLHEEILTTTRLPIAVQFLATEIKHSGVLSTAFERLSHYFSPFQTFVIKQAEEEGMRFTMPVALLILEREAHYKANQPTQAGLFVYQFEALCRNRLGYREGIHAISRDPIYDPDWRLFITSLMKQLGIFELSDLIYLRSDLHVLDQKKMNPDYEPSLKPLFAEREGKIAKASRGRDPLFLFAALSRQLGYPEVPRIKPRDDLNSRLEAIQVKMREMEARIKLLEGESRGSIDWNSLITPDTLKALEEEP